MGNRIVDRTTEVVGAMNQQFQDDEETRARGISEQCWLGPLFLVFLVLVIFCLTRVRFY